MPQRYILSNIFALSVVSAQPGYLFLAHLSRLIQHYYSRHVDNGRYLRRVS
jgi:hypothetical protein